MAMLKVLSLMDGGKVESQKWKVKATAQVQQILQTPSDIILLVSRLLFKYILLPSYSL